MFIPDSGRVLHPAPSGVGALRKHISNQDFWRHFVKPKPRDVNICNSLARRVELACTCADGARAESARWGTWRERERACGRCGHVERESARGEMEHVERARARRQRDGAIPSMQSRKDQFCCVPTLPHACARTDTRATSCRGMHGADQPWGYTHQDRYFDKLHVGTHTRAQKRKRTQRKKKTCRREQQKSAVFLGGLRAVAQGSQCTSACKVKHGRRKLHHKIAHTTTGCCRAGAGRLYCASEGQWQRKDVFPPPELNKGLKLPRWIREESPAEIPRHKLDVALCLQVVCGVPGQF